MARVATRRLIDASASLDAADRALLNLWINHGLPDPALARMTGMEPAAIADRRQGIVERLSEYLGLPPDEVSKALAEVAASSAALPPGEGGPPPEEAAPPPDEESPPPKGDANSAPAGSEDADETSGARADPNLNGRAPAGAVVEPPPPPDANTEPPPPPDAATEPPPPPGAATEPPPPPGAATEPPPPPGAATEPPPAPEPAGDSPPPATERTQTRVLWATCGAVLALLVAGILVIALGSSSGSPRRPAVRPAADITTPAAAPASATQTAPASATQTAPASATQTAPTTPAAPAASTAPTGSTTSTAPAPSPAVSTPPPLPLAALPGGVAKATGSVVLTRDGRKLKLKLTVRGLPAAHHGHYEVWLYDSIIDARPLGRLAASVQHLTVTLPSGARHYRWIDISLQPAGFVNHSGVSVLRAGNPAHTSARQLRKRVHRRRQLRRASGSSRASTSK